MAASKRQRMNQTATQNLTPALRENIFPFCCIVLLLAFIKHFFPLPPAKINIFQETLSLYHIFTFFHSVLWLFCDICAGGVGIVINVITCSEVNSHIICC